MLVNRYSEVVEARSTLDQQAFQKACLGGSAEAKVAACYNMGMCMAHPDTFIGALDLLSKDRNAEVKFVAEDVRHWLDELGADIYARYGGGEYGIEDIEGVTDQHALALMTVWNRDIDKRLKALETLSPASKDEILFIKGKIRSMPQTEDNMKIAELLFWKYDLESAFKNKYDSGDAIPSWPRKLP